MVQAIVWGNRKVMRRKKTMVEKDHVGSSYRKAVKLNQGIGCKGKMVGGNWI
jgi:hypothetical protein